MLRDEHRLREKLDLSLEERQVPALALAVLLLFGAVFGLGVYVGKGLASSAPGPQPQGNLEALDARKEAPPAEARPAPRAESAPAPARPPEDAQAKAAEQRRLEEQKAADAERARKAEEQRLAQQKVAEEKGAQQKAAAHKAEQERKAREQQKSALREKALAAAAAARAGVPASAPASAPTPAEGAFTVQIGASQNRDEAEALQQRARSAGLRPRLVEADLGEKGTWFRVRVGSFDDRAAADRFRRDVERELGGKALVVSTR
jgi:cell division protein FtsN